MSQFGTGFITMLLYGYFSEAPATPGEFELLNGDDFLLLDGTLFLLLGTGL